MAEPDVIVANREHLCCPFLAEAAEHMIVWQYLGAEFPRELADGGAIGVMFVGLAGDPAVGPSARGPSRAGDRGGSPQYLAAALVVRAQRGRSRPSRRDHVKVRRVGSAQRVHADAVRRSTRPTPLHLHLATVAQQEVAFV
jgi:hypothetical protein